MTMLKHDTSNDTHNDTHNDTSSDTSNDTGATIVWLLLMSLGLLMFLLFQTGLEQQALVTLLLVAAWFKGQLIIDYFMGLRRVAVLWRLLISLWLILVLSIVFSVYVWAG